MPNSPVIQIYRLNPGRDADIPLPRYMTPLSAGMDICAAVTETVTVKPGTIELIPTGFALALPEGFEAQIRPRSGWALKAGVTCLNAPGTIDSDYRGEVKVILANLGAEPVRIERGMRIAQIVFAAVTQIRWDAEGSLDETRRGSGGFGHTGV